MTSSRKLSRRLILRGLAGTAIALPLLEYTHGEAWAQTVQPARRFIVVFEHGGTLCNIAKNGRRYDGNGEQNGVDAWKPTSLPGQPLTLGAIHQPIADHAGDLVVLRGIDNMAGRKQSNYDGDHGWCNVTALTAGVASEEGDDDHTCDSPSIDAVMAARLAKRYPVPFPSIHLMVEAHNYGTPFFKAPRQKDWGETIPSAAFKRLFANLPDGGSQVDPAALRAREVRRSVLDGTATGLSQLKDRLGSTDRQTVEAHLDHIRDLERRLSAQPLPTTSCVKPTVGSTPSPKEVGPAHVDILLAAMRCGLTNVAALEIGDLETKWLNPPYPAGYGIGHSLHHASRDVGKTGVEAASFDAWYESMLDNRRWRMELLNRLLVGLKAIPEGGGSMLDNTLVLWTSEFAQGAEHGCADVPVLLAGKAGGRVRTGRHINYNTLAAANPATRDYKTTASTHNLFTSILNIFGEPDTHFGSTGHAYVQGPLPELT